MLLSGLSLQNDGTESEANDYIGEMMQDKELTRDHRNTQERGGRRIASFSLGPSLEAFPADYQQLHLALKRSSTPYGTVVVDFVTERLNNAAKTRDAFLHAHPEATSFSTSQDPNNSKQDPRHPTACA